MTALILNVKKKYVKKQGRENKNATSYLIKNNCGVETRFLGHVLWVLAKTSFTICSNHQLWFL